MKSKNLPPGLFRRFGKYYGSYVDGSGRRCQKALSRHLDVAIKLLHDLERKADLARGGYMKEPAPRASIASLVNDYLSDLATRASANHVYNSRLCLKWWLEQLAVSMVHEISVEDVLRLRRKLVAEGRSNRTANIRVKTLKAMVVWGERVLGHDPHRIRLVQHLPETEAHQRHRRQRLTAEQATKIIAAAMEIDAWFARHKSREGETRACIPQVPLIAAMLETGFRFGEIVALRWCDLQNIDGRFWLVLDATCAKNGDGRSIPIRPHLAKMLRRLRNDHYRRFHRIPAATDPIFLTTLGKVWNARRGANALARLRRAAERAGIPDVDATGRILDQHALRHSFNTMLAENNVPMDHAMALMGHKSAELTARVYRDVKRLPLAGSIDRLPRIDGTHEAERPERITKRRPGK